MCKKSFYQYKLHLEYLVSCVFTNYALPFLIMSKNRVCENYTEKHNEECILRCDMIEAVNFHLTFKLFSVNYNK